MNRPDDRWSGLDPELSRLLTDAVSDVDPGDRLAELRARTSHSPRRPWLLVSGGAAVAAAAVVTAVALAGGNPVPTTTPDPGTATTPATPQQSEPTDPTPSEGTAVEERAIPAYFLGDTPDGLRLYREFQSLPAEPLDGALLLLSDGPVDPDYRTAWRQGQLLSASFDSRAQGLVSVVVDPSVRERPAGMSEAEAEAAVQQVIYTVQAAVQARAPVQFRTLDNPIDQVLGVPTSEPVVQAPPLQTLSLVNLSTPGESAPVTGDSLEVSGVANSFEANVPWSLRDGDTVVADGFFTAEGWMGEQLFPFSDVIDVSSLDPGTYTLTVETDDPTGGAEGPGAYSDTRTIVLE